MSTSVESNEEILTGTNGEYRQQSVKEIREKIEIPLSTNLLSKNMYTTSGYRGVCPNPR